MDADHEKWINSELGRLKDLINERTERVNLQFLAAKEAVEVAKEAVIEARGLINTRMHEANNLQKKIDDRERLLMPREKYESEHAQLEAQMKEIKKEIDDIRNNQSAGSGEKKWTDYLIMLIISAGLIIISKFLFK